MKVVIILCLLVAYVAAQVVVPALPAANVRATQEHLAAVAKATNDHFAAKAGVAPAPYAHYGYAGYPYAHYAGAHYNPHGFNYNFVA